MALNSATDAVASGRLAIAKIPTSIASNYVQKRLQTETHRPTNCLTNGLRGSTRFLLNCGIITIVNILVISSAFLGADQGRVSGARCAMLVTTSIFCSAATAISMSVRTVDAIASNKIKSCNTERNVAGIHAAKTR